MIGLTTGLKVVFGPTLAIGGVAAGVLAVEQQPGTVSEATPISLGLVIVIIGAILVGLKISFWVGQSWTKILARLDSIEQRQADQEEALKTRPCLFRSDGGVSCPVNKHTRPDADQ